MVRHCVKFSHANSVRHYVHQLADQRYIPIEQRILPIQSRAIATGSADHPVPLLRPSTTFTPRKQVADSTTVILRPIRPPGTYLPVNTETINGSLFASCTCDYPSEAKNDTETSLHSRPRYHGKLTRNFLSRTIKNQSETETVIPEHMQVAIAEVYTTQIVHFLQNEQYPEKEALLVTDTEDYVYPIVKLPSALTTETTPIH